MSDSNWKAKYPRNWGKVSKAMRRVADHQCEICGSDKGLAVHHLGIGYVNGLPSDKHDVRRENLQVICFACHDEQEHLWFQKRSRKKRAHRRKERLEKHRALGIGVGLVCRTEVCYA